MLAEDGGLRWSRLENLMEESSKSVGYDASQLWLLAGILVLGLFLAQTFLRALIMIYCVLYI